MAGIIEYLAGLYNEIRNISTVNFTSDQDRTLTTIEARYRVIKLTDSAPSLTTARNAIFPTEVRSWTVQNATTKTITVKTSSGSGVAIPTGKTAMLRCDGASIVYEFDQISTGTASGDVPLIGTTSATESLAGLMEVASASEVTGVHTTGTITSGTAALTVASANGITNGMLIVGEGITPGTYVQSGGGTINLTLSANAGAQLSGDPVAFYKNDVALTPGATAGMLCVAWVNFNGSGTIAISASMNVSSITDNGVGDYTVNFLTAMPDAKYSVVTGHGSGGNNAPITFGVNQVNYLKSTTQVRLARFYNAGTMADDVDLSVAIMR